MADVEYRVFNPSESFEFEVFAEGDSVEIRSRLTLPGSILLDKTEPAKVRKQKAETAERGVVQNALRTLRALIGDLETFANNRANRLGNYPLEDVLARLGVEAEAPIEPISESEEAPAEEETPEAAEEPGDSPETHAEPIGNVVEPEEAPEPEGEPENPIDNGEEE